MTMTLLEKMAMKFMSASICIIIGSLYNLVDAGSYCYKTSYVYGYTTYQYCANGCCSEYTSSPCCSQSSDESSEPVNIGLIVGAVIGGLVGLVLLGCGINLIIHCSKAHTRRSPMIGPQVVTTNTQQMSIQPMVYQPVYQVPVTAYPAYPAYPAPSVIPMPSTSINPSTAEPLPPPIYVEGSLPPADNQKK